MTNFVLYLLFLILTATGATAQPVTPARPVDPNQPLPAQPVVPATPVIPPTPTAPPLGTAAATSAATPETNAPTTSAAPVAISIMADGSLKQVLQELAQNWADTQDSGPQVPLTLTNAGTMRTKIEAGAAWDVVISADVQDVKEMTDRGQLDPDGQRSLARNTLVIYGRNPLIKDDELDWFDLIGTEWKKVAMGNPDLVASGRVAKRALDKHGLADEDHKKLFALAGSEAMALGVVEREEADAVFVYQTDLLGIHLPGFQVFTLKSEDAPPVFYTAAVGHQAKNPTLAHSFIDYCSSDAARAIWAKYGFETN